MERKVTLRVEQVMFVVGNRNVHVFGAGTILGILQKVSVLLWMLVSDLMNKSILIRVMTLGVTEKVD